MNLNIFSDEPGGFFQVAPLRKDGTVAESVLIAGLFVLVAKEMAMMQAGGRNEAGYKMQGGVLLRAEGR